MLTQSRVMFFSPSLAVLSAFLREKKNMTHDSVNIFFKLLLKNLL